MDQVSEIVPPPTVDKEVLYIQLERTVIERFVTQFDYPLEEEVRLFQFIVKSQIWLGDFEVGKVKFTLDPFIYSCQFCLF